MINKTLSNISKSALSLTLLAVGTGIFTDPAAAVDAVDDVGVFNSLTVARSARDAVKAMDSGDWGQAASLFKSAIQGKSDFVGFHYGLLYCGQKSGNWSQVSSALDEIAAKDPAAREHLAFEYGHCYTMSNRPDEAVPYLKLALVKPGDTDFVSKKIRELQQAAVQKAAPLIAGQNGIPLPPVEVVRAPVQSPPIITVDSQNPYTNDVGLNYESAFRASEWIGICEYRGYEKKEGLSFYNLPKANFYWTKCLKGPPLNHDLPVKFRFCSRDGAKMPEGWTFGPDKMPVKGSKWLIFIPNAVPLTGGFDTYKGDYGRQPATETNLGEVYRIIEAHHGQTE